MPDTSRLALPYPQGTDVADVPSDVQVLAEAIDGTAAAWSTGIESARPAAGTAGRWYLASDSGVLYLDTGAAWLRMGPPELATPAGTVLWTAAEAAPTGYLIANGAPVSRSTFSALFSAIGTTYGAGDGSTTFNVPDLRGRTAIGSGQGAGLTNRARGAQVGAEGMSAHVHTTPAHVHSTPAHVHAAGGLTVVAAVTGATVPFRLIEVAAGTGHVRGVYDGGFSGSIAVDDPGHGHAMAGSTASGGGGSTGSGGGGNTGSSGSGSHGVMQPSLALTPIIKT